MADMAKTAQQQQVREQGAIGKAITFPFRVMGVLLGSLVAGILIEWLGLCFLWPEAGWHHARSMMSNELSWVSENFRHSIVVQEPGQTVTWVVEQAYEFLFEKTGITDWIQSTSTQAQEQSIHGLGLNKILASTAVGLKDYALAALYTVLTFLVRLIILILTIPLFLMTIFVGLVDGLVRRDLRRFGAGLESGFVYHRARAMIKPLAVAPWVLYLSLPISISPILVLLPCAATLGIAVSVTVGSFKKYL